MKEITINVNEQILMGLRCLVLDRCSKVLDKMEECRKLGNHSEANQLHYEAEQWAELEDELCRRYEENF